MKSRKNKKSLFLLLLIVLGTIVSPIKAMAEMVVEDSDTIGSVEMKYLDEAGNEILPVEIVEGKIGELYTLVEKSIEDYTLIKTEGNTVGNFSATTEIISYIYQKILPSDEAIDVEDIDNENIDLLNQTKAVDVNISSDLNGNTIESGMQSYAITVGFSTSAVDAGETFKIRIPDIFVRSEEDLGYSINEGTLIVNGPTLEGTPFSEGYQWEGGYWVYEVTMPNLTGYSELVIDIKAPNYKQGMTLADMGVPEGSLMVSVVDKDEEVKASYQQVVDIPVGRVGPPSMSVEKNNRLNLSKPQYADAQKYANSVSLPAPATTSFGKLTATNAHNAIILSASAPTMAIEKNKPATNVEGEFIVPKELDIVSADKDKETPSGFYVQSERLEIDENGNPTGTTLGAQFIQFTEGRDSSDKWVETITQSDGTKKVTFHMDSLDYDRRIYFVVPVSPSTIRFVDGYLYPQYVTEGAVMWDSATGPAVYEDMYVYQTFDNISPKSYSANKKIVDNKSLWLPGEDLTYQLDISALYDNVTISLVDVVNPKTPVIPDSIEIIKNKDTIDAEYEFDEATNTVTIKARNLQIGDQVSLKFSVSTDQVVNGEVIQNTFNLYSINEDEIGLLQGNTVQAEFESAPVTAHYQDTEGKELAIDIVQSGKVGDEYTTEELVIPGYTFKEVIGDRNGVFKEEAQEVTYIYERTDAAPVTAHYQDTEGKELAIDIVQSGKVGDEYTTEELVIPGYTFKEVIGDRDGVFKEEAQEVTYIYEKVVTPPDTIDPEEPAEMKPDLSDSSSVKEVQLEEEAKSNASLPYTGEKLSLISMFFGISMVLISGMLLTKKEIK